jgi:hypothetical protein
VFSGLSFGVWVSVLLSGRVVWCFDALSFGGREF